MVEIDQGYQGANEMNTVVLLTGMNILCLLACHQIARGKRLKPVFWGVLGFILGPIGVLAVLIAKSRKSDIPHDGDPSSE